MISRHSGNKEFASHAGQVRVLVVGDSGVGKSSIVHLILHGRPIKRPMRTVGCSVNVKYFGVDDSIMMDVNKENHVVRSDDDKMKHRSFFVELWDVAGHSSYQASRSLFYNKINGVIFVYDVSKGAQTQSLQKWVAELLQSGTFSAPSAHDNSILPVPLLIIANKSDVKEKDPLVVGKARLLQAANSTKAFEIAYMWAKKHRLFYFSSPPVLPLHHRHSSPGLPACAKEGKLDMNVVNAFFLELIKRSYFSQEVLEHSKPQVSKIKFSPQLKAVGSETVLNWNLSDNSDIESNEESNRNLIATS